MLSLSLSLFGTRKEESVGSLFFSIAHPAFNFFVHFFSVFLVLAPLLLLDE